MSNAPLAPEDVLVIGAGPAGIASAFCLEQAGISYKVVDQADIIASTWASLYPSLQLNTSRWFSKMHGKPFPLHYGIFPSGRQYHAYLSEFVSEHDFNFEFGVEVKWVAPENSLWRVESSAGNALYKAIISATGVFNNPITPTIEGMDDFTGECYHAHDFKHPSQVAGKRVMVVGNGPSGVDISIASAEMAQLPTMIAIRSGVDMRPRYPYGLPKHLWMMIGEHLPKAWCERLLTTVGAQRYEQERYGLYRSPHGNSSAVPYRGPELLHAIRDGKVIPTPAPIRFFDDHVELQDGQKVAVDVVIFATGYVPVLHRYLDIEMQYNTEPLPPQSACEWEIGPNGIRGWPLRDTSTHPNGRQVLGHPGLFLVGTFYKGKGAMYNFNVEAEIATRQIEAYLTTLPK